MRAPRGNEGVRASRVFLKSLTLRGFKSFAEKTTLDFEPGITVIVGPNGSGKSNVVDAIAWVLGEQGPKSLRGGKMEDVIFAGTGSRGALGRAEVALTIDNSAGLLPIEYSEVTVTRHLYRSGESEYAINGTICRLLDIQELLSDTGVGRELHTVLGQNRLEDVLQGRPEDRRAAIEEAAGVYKHRRRKEKALRKLAGMEQHLVRLSDLVGELRRQLKPLQQQAETAARAAEVAAELREVRLTLRARELAGVRERSASLDAEEAAFAARLAELEQRHDAEEATERRFQAELAELEPQAGRATDAVHRLATVRERLKGTVALAEARARHLAEALGDEPPGRSVADLEREAAEVAEELARVEAELAATTETATAAAAERDRARAALAAFDQAAARAERDRAAAHKREVRLASEVAGLQRTIEQMEAEAGRLRGQVAAVEHRRAEAAARLDRLRAERAALESQQTARDTDRRAAEARRDERAAAARRLAAEERRVEAERAAARARREAFQATARAAGGPGGGLEGLAAGAGGGPLGLDPALLGGQAAGGGGPLVPAGLGGPPVGVAGRLLGLERGPLGPEPVQPGGGLGAAVLDRGHLAAQPAGLGLHLLDGPLQAGDLAGQADLALVGGRPVPFGPGRGLVEGGQGGPGPVPLGRGRGRRLGGGGQLGLDPGQLLGHLGRLPLQVGHRAARRLVAQGLGQVAGPGLGQGHRALEALAHGGQAVHGVGGPAGLRLQLGQLGLEAALGRLLGVVALLQLGQPGREGGLLGVQRRRPLPDPGQLPGPQGQADLAQLGRDLGRPGRGLGLLLERLELAAQLAHQVGQPDQVLLHAGQLAQRLLLAPAVLVDAGRLLDGRPPVLGAALEDVLQAVLAEHGVQLPAHPGVGQQLLDVEQPADGAVDGVLALPRAVQVAGDRHLAVLDGQQPGGVVDGEGDLGPAQGAAAARAGEDDVLHLAAAQGLGALLAQHPGDGVDDVGFPGAVGADDDRDPRLEVQGGLFRERLEPAQGQRLEEHAAGPHPLVTSGRPHASTGIGRSRGCRGMSGQTIRGPPWEAPKLTKPWLGQGCFLGGRGAEVLDLAKGELLLRYREVPLELGDTRFEGIQLPQDHVRGRLTYVAHERLRHPGSSSHCSGFGVTAALLSAGLAGRKGRPAPHGTADDLRTFVPWERKTQNVCATLPDTAGPSRYRVRAVPES